MWSFEFSVCVRSCVFLHCYCGVVYCRLNCDNAIGFRHTLISWERPKRARLDSLLLPEMQEHSKTNYTVLDKLTNASLIKSLKCNLIFFSLQITNLSEQMNPICFLFPFAECNLTSNFMWQKCSPSILAFMSRFHYSLAVLQFIRPFYPTWEWFKMLWIWNYLFEWPFLFMVVLYNKSVLGYKSECF